MELRFRDSGIRGLPYTEWELAGGERSNYPVEVLVCSPTVLLVEDDAMHRDFISIALSHEGYQVLVAENGERALAIGDDREIERIDLLISDINMPYLNGVNMSEIFLEMRPKAKVLFISGYSFDCHVEKMMLDRGSGFLAKPFTYDSLIETTELVLGN